MKLLELELTHFGAISNRRLDLSQRQHALHLIYGPNEAGKSTTLRAILALLYGVEHQSPDARLFGSETMRIRGRLSDEQGGEHVVVRRKGNKNTLRDQYDAPLDEAVLSRLLGGLPQSVFATVFGLDHERLRDGGEQLRRGQGNLGESLFQAGVGAPGIHDALHALRAEADALWKPRGKAPLNQALEQYKEARKDVRAHATAADQVRAQQEELERSKARAQAAQQRRAALLAEQSRLQRVLRVLPALAKQRALREQLARLGTVALLDDDAADQRRRAQSALAAADEQCEQLGRSVQRHEQRRAALVIPESLAALGAETVRSMRNQLGNHVKAAEDLPRRQAELRRRTLEAEEVLRELGDPVALGDVERLRVDRAAQARIAKLTSEHSGLHEKMQGAERELASAAEALEQVQSELSAFPLRAGQTRPSAGELALPATARVDELGRRWSQLEQSEQAEQRARTELEARDERLQVALGTLERQGAPPTEQDLRVARAERDQAWSALRAGLERAAELEVGGVQAVEQGVQRADELADRLRREATRVAEHARLLAERDAVERERARLDAQRDAQVAERGALAQAWAELWAGLAIEPGPHAQMSALLHKLSGLLERGRRERNLAVERRAQALQALQAWSGQWAESMAKLRLPASAGVEEALAVQDTLRGLFERVGGIGDLRARIEGIERDAKVFASRVAELVEGHLPELASLSLALQAETFVARYEKAQSDRAQAEQLDADIARDREALDQAEQRAGSARAQLAELMRAAGTAELTALEQAERESAQARELGARLHEVERELFELAEGADLTAIAAEHGEVTPDATRARLSELEEDLRSVNEEHDAAAREIGSLESGLAVIERASSAAVAASDA
ncbi:MAG TPA: AAA family ATPase, partial [Polyangiales bacterium]|nr:AAA family ATPase [Polyangiales bacterium]